MAERRVSASRRFGVLARFGHVARGAVYFVMGIWAGRAAIVTHARALGPGGALRAVIGTGRGHVLIGFIAAGFFADTLFRLIQAVTERKRGRLARLGFLIRGIGAAALGATALEIFRDVRPRGRHRVIQDVLTWALSHPWGANAIVAGGAIAILMGAREIIEGMTGRIREKLAKNAMGRAQARWSLRLIRIGLAAHGTLIAVMGYFFVRAGLEANPRSAVEAGGALRQVGALPYGSALLAASAIGLMAYGAAQWVFALYRRPS